MSNIFVNLCFNALQHFFKAKKKLESIEIYIIYIVYVYIYVYVCVCVYIYIDRGIFI